MTRTLAIVAAIVLFLHGLIHLMGTAAYLKLATIQALPFKTTLLNGRWELGEMGIKAYGALWLVPTIGFAIVAIALLLGWSWWSPALMVIALFSLVLTVLDWNIAFAGILINLVVLAALWLKPVWVSWLAR
jgi:hypothetical protein